MNALWSKLINLLLACYPRPWRDRFGDQVRADLEDARADHLSSAQPLAMWACLTVWDMARGAVRAHIEQDRREYLALANGGGQVPFDNSPEDIRKALVASVRALPFFMVVGTLLIAGGLLLGLGVYDTSQFRWHGLLGLMLVIVFATLFHNRMEKGLLRASTSRTDQLAKNMQMVVMAIMIALLQIALFNYLSDQANTSPSRSIPHAFSGVVGIPDLFIVAMVATALTASVIGVIVASPDTPPRPMIVFLLAVIAAGVYMVVQFGAATITAALLFGLPVAAILLYLWPSPQVPRWARRGMLAMGILPLPLALGFLFAVLHDVSYTRAEIQEKSWIGAAQHPTLRDQAVLYHFALQAVHSGGASENFWSTVRTIEDQRIAWQQHKPWVWMFNARPVGISALDWCMATRTGDPATRIAYCAKGVDEEVWFTRMPD